MFLGFITDVKIVTDCLWHMKTALSATIGNDSRCVLTNNRKINNGLPDLLLVIMLLATLGKRIGVHELSR